MNVYICYRWRDPMSRHRGALIVASMAPEGAEELCKAHGDQWDQWIDWRIVKMDGVRADPPARVLYNDYER